MEEMKNVNPQEQGESEILRSPRKRFAAEERWTKRASAPLGLGVRSIACCEPMNLCSNTDQRDQPRFGPFVSLRMKSLRRQPHFPAPGVYK